MKPLRALCCLAMLLCATLAMAAGDDYRADRTAAEQASGNVKVLHLYEDTYAGPPDGARAPYVETIEKPLPDAAVDGGIYVSPFLHFRVRIPRVAGQSQLSVRQSRPSRRPDGTAVTTHVSVESPGAYGAAALVVTRIREDLPKDADSVLHQFEPQDPADYPVYAKQGVTFRRRQGPLGLSLERTIRNRAVMPLFPFRTGIDATRPGGSLGLSRFIVIDGFLCEFSIVVDGTRATGEAELTALAQAEMDTFMGGLLTPPN